MSMLRLKRWNELDEYQILSDEFKTLLYNLFSEIFLSICMDYILDILKEQSLLQMLSMFLVWGLLIIIVLWMVLSLVSIVRVLKYKKTEKLDKLVRSLLATIAILALELVLFVLILGVGGFKL